METVKDKVMTKWTIDKANSSIEFKIRHLTIANIKGSFKTFDSNICTFKKNFLTAEIDLWIDVASVDTGDPQRDKHLQGADFFDVENHKQISFTSETIGKADEDGNHDLWGELTMRGITRNVKLDVEFGGQIKDPWGNERAGFTVTGKINRSDWGMVYNSTLETGGFMIGNEINILCELQLICSGVSE